MPKSRVEFRTLTGCCGCSLRTTCAVIGLTMISVLTIGAVITPTLFEYPDYLITFSIAILVNVFLVVATILENKGLLLVWFGYGVKFMLGFPLRLESVTSYYRPLYKEATKGNSFAVVAIEFIIVKGFILFSMRMVSSYYLYATAG